MNEHIYFQYEWNYKKEELKFCPRCGHKFVLEDVHIENQPQLICHNCKFIFYIDPKVIVVAVVRFEEKVLLLKRAEKPKVGYWAFPGGHVERHQDVFEAVKNEIKEETGLDVEVNEVRKVYFNKDSGSIELVFDTIALHNNVQTNIESLEAKFFSLSEIPWNELAFEETKEILMQLQKEKA